MNGNGKEKQERNLNQEFFGHIRDAREDLGKPGDSFTTTDAVGWGYPSANFKPGTSKDDRNLNHEKLKSLSIITPEERVIYAKEYVIASAYGIRGSLQLIEELEMRSMAVKGKAREDIRGVMGAFTQHLSIPTSIIQRVKNLRSGNGNQPPNEEPPIAD